MVISSRLRTRLGARAGLFAVSGGALLWGTTGVAVASSTTAPGCPPSRSAACA